MNVRVSKLISFATFVMILFRRYWEESHFYSLEWLFIVVLIKRPIFLYVAISDESRAPLYMYFVTYSDGAWDYRLYVQGVGRPYESMSR